MKFSAVLTAACLLGASHLQAEPKAPAAGMSAAVTTRIAVTADSSEEVTVPEVAPDAIAPYGKALDGTRYTVLRIDPRADGAARVRFDNVHLSPTAKVYVYSVDESGNARGVQVVKGTGPLHNGLFLSQPLSGPIFIEFQPGSDIVSDLPFHVSSVQATKEGAIDNYEADENVETPETKTGWYGDKQVIYQAKEGNGVFEGDILLGTEQQLAVEPGDDAKGGEKSAWAINGSRWPNGVIPYAIDPAFINPSRALDAIGHWNAMLQGVITIVPRTNQNNYINFVNGSGCSSYVGMIGGGQAVTLQDACSTGNAIHEIGHAVGLWHEHTRGDRSKYIVINTANIDPNYAFNFNQTSGIAVSNYDFDSVMHYGAYAFSANGQPTIDTIPAGIPIGQRNGLSANDIAGVRAMYSTSTGTVSGGGSTGGSTNTSSSVTVTVNSNPSGLPVVVDGVSLATPYTTSWTSGSVHSVSAENQVPSSGTRANYVSWSDKGSQTHSVTAGTSSISLTANYAMSFQLTAQNSGPGYVSVNPNGNSGFYTNNSSVSLTAIPDSGSCFLGWTGLMTGTPSTTSVTMNKPYNVMASFGSGAYTLSTNNLTYNNKPASATISVAATGGCTWSATTNENWISINSGTTYTGSSAVTISVARYNGKNPRTGIVTIAGQAVTITQLTR